jgi:hypothetical protein
MHKDRHDQQDFHQLGEQTEVIIRLEAVYDKIADDGDTRKSD